MPISSDLVFYFASGFCLVVVALLFKWLWMPRLWGAPLAEALLPLMFVGAGRIVGSLALVPSMTAGLPREFVEPLGLGDAAAAVLALLAIVGLKLSPRLGVVFAWTYGVVGVADLLNIGRLATGIGPKAEHFGPFLYTSALFVPFLWVSHYYIFRLLLRPQLASPALGR